MIGRENLSVFPPAMWSGTPYLTVPIGKCEPAEPRSCAHTQAIFGERVLHSLSFPTARCIGLSSRVPRLARRWPVMLKDSSNYLS